MRGKELRRDCGNKSTCNVVDMSSESGICTSLFGLCKVYKHGLLQHCRTNRSRKIKRMIRTSKKENMTHRNDGRIEVTTYEDDIVVSGPSYVIRVIF